MTHDVSTSLRLGSLRKAGLATLAAEWLADGGGDRLAVACEQTWVNLTRTTPPLAVYWYDEVAALTRGRAGAASRRYLELVPALSLTRRYRARGDEHERARQRELVALAVGREPRFELRRERRALVVAQRGRDAAEVAVLAPTAPPSTRRHPARCDARAADGADVDEPGRTVGRRRLLGVAELPERPCERRALGAEHRRDRLARDAEPRVLGRRGPQHRHEPAARLEHAPQLAQRRDRIVGRHHARAGSTTASNDASANGSAPLKSASSSVSATPASAARRAATSSCAAFVSIPVTAAPACASATVSRPLPQPASSTRSRARDRRDDLGGAERAAAHCSRGSQPKRRHAIDDAREAPDRQRSRCPSDGRRTSRRAGRRP